MRAVGFVATGVVLLIIAVGIVLFLLSLPDLLRYRRIRKL
jgi:hypothetical protein